MVDSSDNPQPADDGSELGNEGGDGDAKAEDVVSIFSPFRTKKFNQKN